MAFRKYNIIVLFLIFLLQGGLFAQSIGDVRKQREKSEKEIQYLNKLLNEAAANKSVSLEKLNILQQKISTTKKLLNSLNQEVNYIQSHISVNENRIRELEVEKKSMLDLYAKLVYGSWKKRDKTNKLMFILSSSDFNQAYNRFKYFQQIQEYSGRQLELIRQVNDSLELKNQELKKLVEQKNLVLNDMDKQNRELETEKVKENKYITELKDKEKEVRKKLQKETEKRKKLEQQLAKLIANQAKKSGSSSSVYKLTPEEKLISDDFEKNKGKLPWPVAEGFISEKFGIKRHSELKYVQINNDGINITTTKNADVRAVFQGVVIEICYISGYNVVIIRHGKYMSVYPNLSNVTVKKGEKVATKQIIGKIAYDDEKGNVINFQIWQDLQKLDPELWLAK